VQRSATQVSLGRSVIQKQPQPDLGVHSGDCNANCILVCDCV